MSTQQQSLNHLLGFLTDNQAIDVITIDVHHQTTVTDYMIITSGRSSRHVKAIAYNAMETMKAIGIRVISEHGLDQGDWVLIDFGDYVLHIMQPDSRAFYNLEGLWQDSLS
jgi:ribosome-associated protein